MKKWLIVIVLLMLTITITGCFEEGLKGEDIDPNETTREEDILGEDLKFEDILKEHKLDEYTMELITLIERYLEEDVVLEDIKVDMILAEDIEGLFDEYFNGSAGEYDIDWWSVFGNLAVGSTVIIVTGTLAMTTANIPGVGYVFASSFKGAAKESIMGAAIGGALSAAIEVLLKGRELDSAMKYALKGAANGFMWGAITGAIIGAASGYNRFKNPSNLFDGNRFIGKVTSDATLVDVSNKTIGFVTPNNYVVDLNGKVIGNVIKNGDDFIYSSIVKSYIPKNGIIYTSKSSISGAKTQLYTVNSAKQVFHNGRRIGWINEAGQIIDDLNHMIGMVDDYGRLIPGFAKTTKAGFVLNPSGAIVNKTKITNGVIEYLDDAGKAIGFLQKASDRSKSVYNIMLKVDSKTVNVIGDIPSTGLTKIVGQVDEAGKYMPNWLKNFQLERSKGVDLAWVDEVALIKSKGCHITLVVPCGTRSWSPAELAEIIRKGRVTGIQGHHINSALYSPALAANPNNIIFYSASEHLALGHFGSYQNVTFGSLLSRLF